MLLCWPPIYTLVIRVTMLFRQCDIATKCSKIDGHRYRCKRFFFAPDCSVTAAGHATVSNRTTPEVQLQAAGVLNVFLRSRGKVGFCELSTFPDYYSKFVIHHILQLHIVPRNFSCRQTFLPFRIQIRRGPRIGHKAYEEVGAPPNKLVRKGLLKC